MAENKVCPHCGSKMFAAAITRGGVIEVLTSDTDDKSNTYKILKESKDKYDIKIIQCLRCHNEISEEDLVVSVICKECGKTVTPQDVNEEGVCSVCVAQKERTELASASREDLIKMLLDAEKRNNSTASKIEKNVAKAIAVEESLPDTSHESNDNSNDVDNDTSNDNNAEEAPKKKRRPRAKKENDKEENISSDVVNVSEAVNELANQQEAPFPDVNDLPMNPPVDVNTDIATDSGNNSNNDEQPIGADFKMFEADEEPF